MSHAIAEDATRADGPAPGSKESIVRLAEAKNLTLNDAAIAILADKARLPGYGEPATPEQRMRRRLLDIAVSAIQELTLLDWRVRDPL